MERGGIGPVRFTLAADVKHEICRAYGVENDDGVAHEHLLLPVLPPRRPVAPSLRQFTPRPSVGHGRSPPS